jgi:glycosyltransferase involved in cell wall biosynthesis
VDVVTMGFRGLAPSEEVDGIRVHRVPCVRRKLHVCTAPEAASYLAATARTAGWLASKQRYDLIHAHFIFPDGLIAWLLHRRTGVPYLITAHGTDVPGYNPHRHRIAHWLLAPLWRRVVRGAALVICPSATLECLVRARCAATTTAVVPNEMDMARFRPSDGRKQKRILVVTRMLERKGVQYFLEALNGFASAYEVHIVGDGPYLPTLQDMVRHNGPSVRFWGWLDNRAPQLQELYETSSIFVLPSEGENFPVVLLEAMAAGLAIVTTEGTGCAEVVGRAALLVPPKDPGAIRQALRRLIEDEARCRALGEAAQRRLEERFSWTGVARAYEQLYATHRGQYA